MNKLVLNSICIILVTPYNLNKMIHVKHQVYPFMTFWCHSHESKIERTL